MNSVATLRRIEKRLNAVQVTIKTAIDRQKFVGQSLEQIAKLAYDEKPTTAVMGRIRELSKSALAVWKDDK